MVVIGNLGAVAINAATSTQSRWPGGLDVIQRYPFSFSGGLTILAAAVAVAGAMWARPLVATDGPGAFTEASAEVSAALLPSAPPQTVPWGFPLLRATR